MGIHVIHLILIVTLRLILEFSYNFTRFHVKYINNNNSFTPALYLLNVQTKNR